VLFPNLTSSASMRDWGGSATLGCRSLYKVYLTAFDNHGKRSLIPKKMDNSMLSA
jgi:hypothetical protein